MNRRSNFGKFILLWAGLFIIGFGLFENVIPICVFGFGFFATLPFANNCLDYLARTNIADEVQGRAWGMIGFLSRIGYVIAYAISGIAADKLGKFTGLGVGRGAAAGVRIAGICMVLVAVICSLSASLRRLERAEGEC